MDLNYFTTEGTENTEKEQQLVEASVISVPSVVNQQLIPARSW